MKHMMPPILFLEFRHVGAMNQGPQGTPTCRLHQEHKLIAWSNQIEKQQQKTGYSK